MAKHWRPEAGQFPTIKKSNWGETRTQEANAMHFSKSKGTPGERGFIPSFRQYCAELLGPADDRGDWSSVFMQDVITTIRDHMNQGGTDHPLWVKLQIAKVQAERFATPAPEAEQSSRHIHAQRMADAMDEMIYQVKEVRRRINRERKFTCYRQCH